MLLEVFLHNNRGSDRAQVRGKRVSARSELVGNSGEEDLHLIERISTDRRRLPTLVYLPARGQ